MFRLSNGSNLVSVFIFLIIFKSLVWRHPQASARTYSYSFQRSTTQISTEMQIEETQTFRHDTWDFDKIVSRWHAQRTLPYQPTQMSNKTRMWTHLDTWLIVFKWWQLFANTPKLANRFLFHFVLLLFLHHSSLIAFCEMRTSACTEGSLNPIVTNLYFIIFFLFFGCVRLTRCRRPTNAYLIGTATNDTHICLRTFLCFRCVRRLVLAGFWGFVGIFSSSPSVDNAFIIVHRSISVENCREICHAECAQRIFFFGFSCIWLWFEVRSKASWKRMADKPTIITFGKSIYSFILLLLLFCCESNRECGRWQWPVAFMVAMRARWSSLVISFVRWRQFWKLKNTLCARVSPKLFIVASDMQLLPPLRIFCADFCATKTLSPLNSFTLCAVHF